MKLVREYINEKFSEDSDPIIDMGIGMIGNIKKAIDTIYKEDKKNLFKGTISSGTIHFIKITRAVGRGQQHHAGNYMQVNMWADTMYDPIKKFKNNNPRKLNRVQYIGELIEKAGISECFSDIFNYVHTSYVIFCRIKPEYRKYFVPGLYSHR